LTNDFGGYYNDYVPPPTVSPATVLGAFRKFNLLKQFQLLQASVTTINRDGFVGSSSGVSFYCDLKMEIFVFDDFTTVSSDQIL
jgi:hypothetical protein